MIEAAENHAHTQAAAVKTCPVSMRGAKPCGRPLYGFIANDDPTHVCLMHTHHYKKDAAFRVEFDHILNTAGHGLADFTRFVFLTADYKDRLFEAECEFNGAVFTRRADFVGATFAQAVDFRGAHFAKGADFAGAKFMQGGNFVTSKFRGVTSFSGARFTQGADFTWARFASDALFHKSEFRQEAQFHEATFQSDVDFTEAAFTTDANFYGTSFAQRVRFNKTRFAQLADFTRVRFFAAAEFLETDFRQDDDAAPGPVFSSAEFSHPETVLFYRSALDNALFHNCDVSRISFSSVHWREREGSRKRMVFEETVELSYSQTQALRPRPNSPDERDFDLVAGLYQQLKKNYDDSKDYQTGGDFHYGELEMRRQATPDPGRIPRAFGTKVLGEARFQRLRQLWHRKLSLIAWYKYASEYGESHARPLLLLFFFVFLLFPFAYAISGLTHKLAENTTPLESVEPSGATLRTIHESQPADAQEHLSQIVPNGSSKSEKRHTPIGAVPKVQNPPKPSIGTRENVRGSHSEASLTKQLPSANPQLSTTPVLSPSRESTARPTPSVVILTYWQPFLPTDKGDELFRARLRLLRNSLITSLDVAAYQRDKEYEPKYPLGHIVALLETFLTSTLFALFLLALRRQFRR
jgi:uncharacterized protein YjbI with pentapeptide repeats